MPSINTIGNLCIGLSVGISVAGIVLLVMGRLTSSAKALSIGRGTLYANFILLTIANLAMVYALLSNDFSVSYVTHVGSRETPRWIAAISLWSSLEGSILFWGWVLAAYAAVCTYQNREHHPHLMAWVGMVLLGIELFFSLLLAIPANPFLPVDPTPLNGAGPNPLLQNHWLMAAHPPCLYIGYIGFTIPFAFAIAELLEGGHPPPPNPLPRGEGEGGGWITMSRRWTLFAWSFLSIAIVLGGWWSYAVLGWGGYWAWDPVENASFMPWLTGTALIHSTIVHEKRKLLSIWNLTLAILTFLLTILGTFLTRSGVLESVHSFTESAIGPYFLLFIGVVLIGSVGLLLWRAPFFRQSARIESLFSLEVLFLFNNLLFVSFCFIVFLGTLYPLAVEAISGDRISVGEPYFNQMTAPIVGMILLLMGFSLLIPWKRAHPKTVWRRSRLPLLLSFAVTSVSVALGGHNLWLVVIILFASFAFFVMLIEWASVTSKRHGRIWQLLNEQPRRYGGFVAHTGALIIIVAVALSHIYEQEKEIALQRGESANVFGYTLTLGSIEAHEVPQRFEVKALIDLAREEKYITMLTPQMNYYSNSREPIGSPAIQSTWKEDIYLTLINVERDGSKASLRVITAPAVSWIWIGGGIVMAGGLMALALGRWKKEEAV